MKPNCDGSMMGGGNMEAFDKLPRPCAKLLQALITIGAHAKLSASGAQRQSNKPSGTCLILAAHAALSRPYATRRSEASARCVGWFRLP